MSHCTSALVVVVPNPLAEWWQKLHHAPHIIAGWVACAMTSQEPNLSG